MGAPAKGSRYVLVSPIKDEEKYVETTLRAVLNQTVRPFRWVLVDDGSRDRTHEILESYARGVDWITLVTIRRDAARQPGSGIIRAFNEGFKVVQDEEFDFVVKLDCDIDFPPDYFESLMDKFQQDPRLGIASGVYLESPRGEWVTIKMPAYHAAGQTKMVRRGCFREIGGFVAVRGWDSLDEIKAQSAGWKTGHFQDIQFYHLKLEGSGIGFLRTSMMLGEIYYMTGGGPLFFTLKSVHYAFARRPFFLGSLMLIVGYLRPLLTRRKRLVTSAEARLYRNMLNRRIVDALSDALSFRRFRRKEQPA
jgi:biofilm PGA synthesis N-glycosyltransferase PgaC